MKFLSTLLLFVSVLSATAQQENWETLNEQGMTYYTNGDYVTAREIWEKALLQAEREFSKNHLNYTIACDNLAEAYFGNQQYGYAETFFIESKNIREKLLGKQSEYYALSCYNVAYVYMEQKDDVQAESLFIEARSIMAGIGTTEANYLTFSNQLSIFYLDRRLYSKAEPLFLEMQTLRRSIHGAGSMEYANACENLFHLYEEQGNHLKAQPYFTETKSILNALQRSFWKTVDFKNMNYSYGIDNPEKRMTDAKNGLADVLEQYGKDDTYYPNAITVLARAYDAEGNYSKAEPLYSEARDIYKRTNNPQYAAACGELASLYTSLGDYARAETLYLEENILKRNSLGRDHINYGTSCNNFGLYYLYRGEYSKAEPLLLNALLIFAKINYGYTYYSAACEGLAMLYANQNKFSIAESYYLESMEIRKMAFGKTNYVYGMSASNLGVMYRKQNNFAKAEPLLVQANASMLEAFGPNSSIYAGSSYELALMYHKQGLYTKAEPLYTTATAIKLSSLDINFTNLSEKEQYQYYQSIREYFTNYTSFALAYQAQKPSITIDLYNLQLATKGLLFQSSQKTRLQIMSSGDTSLIHSYEILKSKRNYLAKVYQMPVSQKQSAHINEKLLEEEITILEKDITNRASSYVVSGLTETSRPFWQDVKARLNEHEAAVEIIRASTIKGDTVYLALIIRAGTQSQPDLVVFKNGHLMERKSILQYNDCIQSMKPDNLSYITFWKPLADQLQGIQKVYLSPDGIFHQISFATLKNPATGAYLSDELTIQILGSTRDVMHTTTSSGSTQVVLFGYPDYRSSEATALTTSSGANGYSTSTSSLYKDIPDAARGFNRATGSITPLPGTKTEVLTINQYLIEKHIPSTLYMGKQAGEAQLKQVKDPKILHIATHGFFLPDHHDATAVVEKGDVEFRSQTIQNPLFRSGLLLAGCERALQPGQVLTGEEDGILTAYEAMNLHLDKTDLVVLSACETGLGDIQNGEGVYGLQRSFQQAGTKAILISLWKVSDEATQLLMTALYKEYLLSGDITEAFIKARHEVRLKYPEPYYWGAFVLITG